MNKKVVEKGQVVFTPDHGRCRPRAYSHRHKLHDYPKELTRMGACELHYLASLHLEMVVDPTIPTTSEVKEKNFRKKMDFTVGNFFICDKGLDWAGAAGIGLMGTNTRKCLPKDIESHFLQVKKTTP